MKIRTLAIVLVAVPLLAYGSVKLYLNSRIDDLMTRLAEGPLRPVATLRWGDIETTLSGEASVHDIRLDLRRPADTITIERITYDTPNIWYLMRDLGDVQNNRVPSSLHLRTEGVRLDLYGELTEQLEQVINELNLDLAGVSKLCGGRLFMGPRELRDMGYDAVIFDADAGIDIDNITEEITWSLQLAVGPTRVRNTSRKRPVSPPPISPISGVSCQAPACARPTAAIWPIPVTSRSA